MRKREKQGDFSVHAIAGTYVIILGINAPKAATKKLLGFAIHREDHTENEQYWLQGFKTFKETEPEPAPGSYFSTLEHPIQSFLWGDYTAKPDHDYTYTIVPIQGNPKNLVRGQGVTVRISTESEDQGSHAVYFNRGVAASQAYAKKFKNKKPDVVPGRKALIWLSRGLEEAILRFIAKANGPEYKIRASVYEFNYEPVLLAFKKASDSGADVKIIYDSRKDNPKEASDEAIKKAGMRSLMIRRTQPKSYISHNKFIVLLKKDEPVEVWTGSTNFTKGGIFGQSNLGHICRDRNTVKKYYDYWTQLEKDPTNKSLRIWIEQETPDPEGKPVDDSITPIFSPRKTLNTLMWYTERMDAAKQTINLTAAFGVNSLLAVVLAKDKDYLRYLLLERKGKNYSIYSRDRDVRISIGAKLGQDHLYQWTREELTNYNFHVRYVHTKFLLIDPLSNNPTVITGSANFSDASTKKNDENMLIIHGNTRVADIYLGEYMRLFNHFYFRYIANLLKDKPESKTRERAFLVPNDSWCEKYYEDRSIKKKQRILFG